MPTREDDHYAARAASFADLERMRDHFWWRPGWRVGRSHYTFHVTFDRSPAVVELARHYRDRLTLPSIDPVPDEGLHLTMQGVGFTDEVSRDDISAIAEAARVRCARLTPFEVELGPVDADPEGVMFNVRPWSGFEEVRATVREAIADVWGAERVPEPADGFVPHVTVAYSNSSVPAGPLREALARVEPVTLAVPIRSVQLIDLNRDEKVYRWSTVADLPFSPEAA
jgi:2'-5' RNA ligase